MIQYFPHTAADIEQMLERCGMKSLEELYADVPQQLRLGRDYDLPEPKNEDEVREYLEGLASHNTRLICYAGAGFYDHYSPAAVSYILSRSEFLTAYTPYQPEISQGTLRYIFEYQTMMCELTGLDVSNASMYDGSTAMAEAMMMAVAASRKRNCVLVSATVNPVYREVMATYALYHGINLEVVPEKDGVTDLEALKARLSAGDVAGVALATPNFCGILEDYSGVADVVHAAKALLIMTAPASALAVVKTPAEWGADIAAGEAQSLGMPLDFGGPGLGYMCCTKALMRKLPGRIVGKTQDAAGKTAYVLTLQAREQHIRRDKATSNICSNQGLMALYAAVYLSLMGPHGMAEVNRIGCDGAHHLAEGLCATGLFTMKYPGKPFLNEFALKCRDKESLDRFCRICSERGILPGVRLDDTTLLTAVTERRTLADNNIMIYNATLAAEGQNTII
ncbi:MAG: aminomethyl-transferring glycine dehydrogenase subunit GcvPA [Muribaculaceae bacterium]|nr:aminomethyl-transferring glycine dehydrogenase subunit GcvPA [Muribaculaceae bacterium]